MAELAKLAKERQRLKKLGCIEFKAIANKIGQKFRTVRAWSEKIDSSPVIQVSGYWQVQNAQGYKITMYGDDLVLLTDEPLSRSIYADNGLDFKKHSEILLADIT
jgi:hypothetical protein